MTKLTCKKKKERNKAQTHKTKPTQNNPTTTNLSILCPAYLSVLVVVGFFSTTPALILGITPSNLISIFKN